MVLRGGRGYNGGGNASVDIINTEHINGGYRVDIELRIYQSPFF